MILKAGLLTKQPENLYAQKTAVTAELRFETGEATTEGGLVDGSVTLKLQVTASLMKGVTTIAFEKLYLDGLNSFMS